MIYAKEHLTLGVLTNILIIIGIVLCFFTSQNVKKKCALLNAHLLEDKNFVVFCFNGPTAKDLEHPFPWLSGSWLLSMISFGVSLMKGSLNLKRMQ